MANLPPHGQLSRLIEELFPEDMGAEWEGTLVLEAEGGEICTVALEMGASAGELTTLPVAPSG